MSESYRVLSEMRYLDSPDEQRAMKLGERQAFHWHYAKPGEVVADIPREALKWLLRDGHIEAVATPATKPAKGKDVSNG